MKDVAGLETTHPLLIITITTIITYYSCGCANQPPKIDLGFILDTSFNITNSTHQTAIQIIKNFANHLSISPGTTRVALYTVSDEKSVEQFAFNKYVNCECLLKGLRSVTFKQKQTTLKANNKTKFRSLLKKAITSLRRQGNEISGQRRIYIFITSFKEKMVEVKSKSISEGGGEIYSILINTNKTKEFNKEKVRSKYFVYYDKDDYQEISKKLKLNKMSYLSCATNGHVIDECERHCTCVAGKITNCYRVRHEFSAMTTEQRRRYIKTYKTLTSVSPYKERYERFIFMHYKYFCFGIHGPELFLPWHRWYLSVMEDLLREVDCRVTIPYWDWSVVGRDPWNSSSKLWSSSDEGLGGNGDKYKGYCVQDGPFNENSWETPYWEDPLQIMTTTIDQLDDDIDDQRAHLAYCLRRGFHGKLPGVQSIKNILKIPPNRFRDFNLHIIHNYHNKLHNSIGGTMSTDYAADAPEFFLHHAFLDNIWYKWQNQSIDHKYVHFLQRNKTKMMGCEYKRSELIDSHNLPRCIKVRYTNVLADQMANFTVTDPPPVSEPAPRREKRLKDDIDDMARTPYTFWDPYLRGKWDGVFPSCAATPKDKRRAHKLHLKIDEPYTR